MPQSLRFAVTTCGLTIVFAGGCSMPIQRVDVQSFEVRGNRITADRAHAELTAMLVERGFDIKATDRDAGLVTTEYKKFAAQGKSPPFDYYLQLRVNVRTMPGGVVNVRLSPFVKAQNRMNAAAFTETELSYCEGKPSTLNTMDSMKKEGWQTLGQLSFMNVVSDVATKFGMAVDDVVKNVTRTPKNGFLAESCH
jgi:hypothetical protein